MGHKIINVVVFGHYDSRGGTTAIEVAHLTADEVRAAFKRYDVECFGIEHPGDTPQRTVYGMRTRAVDRAVHQMLYGKGSVAVDDFLFAAHLHVPGHIAIDPNQGTDLDDPHGNRTVVLIDEATTPPGYYIPNPPEYSEWTDAEKMKWQRDRDDEYGAWVRATFEVTMQMPTQLEVVELPPSWGEKEIDHESERMIENSGYADFAQVLFGESVIRRNWNDDAFGFLLIPQMRVPHTTHNA
jgi:hypothetical protein